MIVFQSNFSPILLAVFGVFCHLRPSMVVVGVPTTCPGWELLIAWSTRSSRQHLHFTLLMINPGHLRRAPPRWPKTAAAVPCLQTCNCHHRSITTASSVTCSVPSNAIQTANGASPKQLHHRSRFLDGAPCLSKFFSHRIVSHLFVKAEENEDIPFHQFFKMAASCVTWEAFVSSVFRQNIAFSSMFWKLGMSKMLGWIRFQKVSLFHFILLPYWASRSNVLWQGGQQRLEEGVLDRKDTPIVSLCLPWQNPKDNNSRFTTFVYWSTGHATGSRCSQITHMGTADCNVWSYLRKVCQIYPVKWELLHPTFWLARLSLNFRVLDLGFRILDLGLIY